MNKVMLIIRDGWGYSEKVEGNAINMASTPNDDRYRAEYPTSVIQATGGAVGNPDGVQGGSEVGHLTLGAGRVVWQPYELINRTVTSGEFFVNSRLIAAIENCKARGTRLHLNGLFSDQGIHADYRHMHELLRLCKQLEFTDVFVHLTLDGRDVPERSALTYLKETERVLGELGVGTIATVCGRYYSMDRDSNWDRTMQAVEAMVSGEGHVAASAAEAIEAAYARGDSTDYYVQPTVIAGADGAPVAKLSEGDSFIWFNFRSDRSRQITEVLSKMESCPLDMGNIPSLHYVCFSSYDSNWKLPVAFPQQSVTRNLGETLSRAGAKQLRVAETEKFAHVTFFFNSQLSDPFEGESRILVESPKVESYAQKPEMSAGEVTDKLLPEIGSHDFILLNYANPDLVGHSGVLEATVKACEFVDMQVGRVVDRALEEGYAVLLMADHGNADHMLYDNGEPDPSHGHNPVLLSLLTKGGERHTLADGGMKDIAPTILGLMGIPVPEEMTGESLV